MRQVVYRIYIRDHPVSQTQILFGGAADLFFRLPRFFAHKFVARRMKSVDRAEYAELQPPEIQLVVLISHVVTAYVVTPPCVSHVGRRRRHVRLKIERSPRHRAVSAETYRIPVTAYARVSRQDQHPLSLVAHVERMVMVECPQRVESFDVTPLALLPVYPPESHAFALIGSVYHVEIRLEIFLVTERKTYRLARGRIDTAYRAYVLVHIFEISDSLRGMKIERHIESAVVQIVKERAVIGEEFGIPAVTSPARDRCVYHTVDKIVGRLCERVFTEPPDDVYPVPVHVYRRDGDRHFSVDERLHKTSVFVLRVRLVSAPPVAESELRQQRSEARQSVQIAYRAAIIAAVCEIISVGTFLPLLDLVTFQNERPGVVQHRDASPRDHAAAQPDFAVGHIESASRAGQHPLAEVFYDSAVRERDPYDFLF